MADRIRTFRFWTPLLFGLMLLTVVLTKPSVSTYRPPDVIMLVMGGFLCGVAVTGFVAQRSRTRSS
jgi:hypothetical protein